MKLQFILIFLSFLQLAQAQDTRAQELIRRFQQHTDQTNTDWVCEAAIELEEEKASLIEDLQYRAEIEKDQASEVVNLLFSTKVLQEWDFVSKYVPAMVIYSALIKAEKTRTFNQESYSNNFEASEILNYLQELPEYISLPDPQQELISETVDRLIENLRKGLVKSTKITSKPALVTNLKKLAINRKTLSYLGKKGAIKLINFFSGVGTANELFSLATSDAQAATRTSHYAENPGILFYLPAIEVCGLVNPNISSESELRKQIRTKYIRKVLPSWFGSEEIKRRSIRNMVHNTDQGIIYDTNKGRPLPDGTRSRY